MMIRYSSLHYPLAIAKIRHWLPLAWRSDRMANNFHVPRLVSLLGQRDCNNVNPDRPTGEI